MRPGPDARLLRRAAWSVSLQTALAAALVVVVVALGSVAVFDRQQAAETTDVVRQSALTADDVRDPPEGVWVVRLAGQSRTASDGVPPEVVTAAALGSAPPGPLSLTVGGRHFSAWVAQHTDARFVAVYDESRHRAEEHRLVVSTTVAGLAGVLLAALLGLVVGRRAVAPLGQALALQRRFVADASHELRTPLAVLHTRAQMLRRHLGADLPVTQREEVDQLVADTGVLGEVVADLLLSAELQHASLAAEDVDVTEMATQVVRSLRPYAAAAGIRLVPRSVGAAAADVGTAGLTVRGAPTALRRALTALVDNAIAHSPRGGEVRVRVDGDREVVVVAVEDEGDGVDPARIDALTKRFARGGAEGGGGRRFGLGLALVDEVVRAHRGQLVVTGRPGEGATFTLRLPRVRVTSSGDGTGSSPAR